MLLTATLYYGAGRIGKFFTFGPHPVSVLWPTNSVLFSMLLLAPMGRWPLVLLAAFPAHLLLQLPTNVPVPMCLLWFVSNCVEGLIGAASVRLFIGTGNPFGSTRKMAVFIGCAVLAPFASSFLDAAFVRWMDWGRDSYWEVWRIRFFSNVVAALSVVPLLVTLGSHTENFLKGLVKNRGPEAMLLLMALWAAGILQFWEQWLPPVMCPTLVYLPLPVLLWAALRFGVGGLSSASLLTAFLLTFAALRGHGPFSHLNPVENVFSIQVFLISACVPLMLVSTLTRERESTTEALSESEDRFRFAADSAPVMVWLSGPDKKCTFVNKMWLEYTGRRAEEELGDGWTENVHPDDLAETVQTYSQNFDQRKRFRMEYRVRKSNGEFGWVLDEGIPRYSRDGTFCGYVGTTVDITERKLTEKALRRSEKRYRELVESQTDLVCRFLLDGTLTFINEAYARFCGKARELLIGRSALDLIPADQHKTILKRIYSGGHAPATFTFESKAAGARGKEHWLHWIVYPTFDDYGNLAEFQAIGRDVTERRLAEESLERTQLQIDALTRRLLHAQEEERRRIARDLHDDFNQRLAAHTLALHEFGRTLASGDDQVIQSLEKLQNEAISLSDEIRLIAHGLHQPRLEQTGFEKALRSSCDEFTTLTHLSLDLRVDPGLALPADLALCCYRVIQEALRNIATHAHAKHVQVRVSQLHHQLLLLVADDGVGIEAEKAGALSGLGLISMKERVEYFSGKFNISKRKNGGTLLSIEFPLYEDKYRKRNPNPSGGRSSDHAGGLA